MKREGWLVCFAEPLAAGKRRRIVTLSDARKYILRLSKAERERPEWQMAVETLADAAASGNVAHAENAMREALHHSAGRLGK